MLKTETLSSSIIKEVDNCLDSKYEFEQFLLDLLSERIMTFSDEIVNTIKDLVKVANEFLNFESGIFVDFNKNVNGDFRHEWILGTPFYNFGLKKNSFKNFKWVLNQIENHEHVIINKPVDFPVQAQKELQFYISHEIKAFICIPLVYMDKLHGLIAFYNKSTRIKQPEALELKLKLISKALEVVYCKQTAANNLLQKEKALKQSILSSPNPVFTIDRKGNFKDWNPACENILKLSPKVKGKHYSILFEHSDQLENCNSIVKEVFNNKIFSGIEISFSCLDGSKCVSLSRIYPLANLDGEIKEVVFGNIDITGRKKIEQDLENTNAILELFMYRSSHNLRGPVASILGLINIANNEVKDTVALKYLNLIDYSSKKLEQTLHELLEVVMIRQAEIELQEINLHALYEESISTLSSLPNFQSIGIKINFNSATSFITDRNIFLPAFNKILENAILYCKPSSHPKIEISFKKNKKGIKIIFSDNGIGISEEYQNKIFDMFFRATEKSKGAGLGLYIAKSAIEKLGGTISVKSAEGKGACFTICIPT